MTKIVGCPAFREACHNGLSGVKLSKTDCPRRETRDSPTISPRKCTLLLPTLTLLSLVVLILLGTPLTFAPFWLISIVVTLSGEGCDGFSKCAKKIRPGNCTGFRGSRRLPIKDQTFGWYSTAEKKSKSTIIARRRAESSDLARVAATDCKSSQQRSCAPFETSQRKRVRFTRHGQSRALDSDVGTREFPTTSVQDLGERISPGAPRNDLQGRKRLDGVRLDTSSLGRVTAPFQPDGKAEREAHTKTRLHLWLRGYST